MNLGLELSGLATITPMSSEAMQKHHRTLEAAGVKDVLTKSLGSSTPSNVVQATVLALRQLRTRETIYKIRGRSVRPAKEKAEVKN